MGVVLHLGSAVADVIGEDCVEGVTLENGTSLARDIIVLAVGSRPNVEIAVRAGLAVELAIIVDSHMRSVDGHSIFAVDECAQKRGGPLGSELQSSAVEIGCCSIRDFFRWAA